MVGGRLVWIITDLQFLLLKMARNLIYAYIYVCINIFIMKFNNKWIFFHILYILTPIQKFRFLLCYATAK